MNKKIKIILSLTALFTGAAFSSANVEIAYLPFMGGNSAEPSVRDNYAVNGYAYAPSTVYYNGTFHQFYCSSGNGSDDNYYHPDMVALHASWDHIRYRTSKNGSSWSAPRIALSVTIDNHSNQNERCTCDPSVVRGNDGYWYMMYDGNLAEYSGTVVYLARSEVIQGPYYKYTKRGTWERFPTDPKPIFKYQRAYNGIQNNTKYVLNPANSTVKHEIYGTGQQSVVFKDGYFHVWFSDKNIYFDNNNNVYYKIRYVKTKRLEALDFNNTSANNTSTYKLVKLNGSSKIGYNISGVDDVKWNPDANRFEMWTMEYAGANESYKIVKYYSAADDGVNWTKDSNFSMGPYNHIHNLGVSGDEYGAIYGGRYLISFSAPKEGLYVANANIFNGGIWPMYQKLVGIDDWLTYKVKIDNGAQLDVAPSNAEYYSGDFDGDGITDIGVLDKDNGNWYTVYSRKYNGYTGSVLKTTKKSFYQYDNKHKIVIGDFDGDGKDDRGMYKISYLNGDSIGLWYIYSSKTNGGRKIKLVDNDVNGLGNIGWGWGWGGMASSFTVPRGDYDGDGITDRVIVNPAYGKWYMLSSRLHDFLTVDVYGINPGTNDSYQELLFDNYWYGMNASHEVVVGDFDGDGITDRSIIDKAQQLWYVIPSRSQNPNTAINFFLEQHKPSQHLFGYKESHIKANSIMAIGDYDGDGIDDLSFVNKSAGKWYFRKSTTGAVGTPFSWDQLKTSSIQLLPGDYDGDGITDMAFIDKSTRKFYVRSSKKTKEKGATYFGVNETIRAAYPLYSSSLSKTASPETDNEISQQKNEQKTLRFNIQTSGRTLMLSDLAENEKVFVMDVRGMVVFSSMSHANELKVNLPSVGKYIVRVGTASRMITIK